MLVELTITNLAIIEALRLAFAPGFSVLTGETGAGKSIIIDAVNLLLGGRASAELIRTGCESAVVEGLFSLDGALAGTLGPVLQEYGLEDEGGELILRREVGRSGRSSCRINGHAMTLSTLQEVGHHLIDIHGQGDHLSLLQVRRHVDFLDHYGGLWEQRKAFAQRVAQLREVRHDLRALHQDERELARRVDLLTYQVEDIANASLRPGEEDELRRERSLLANAEKLTRLAAESYALLAEGEEGQRSAVDLLAGVTEAVGELARLDESLSEQNQLAQSLFEQLEDLARTVRNYRDNVEYDPERLQTLEERLDLIQGLKRKYGEDIAAVLAFAERAQRELDSITHSEERAAALEVAEQTLLGELATLGGALRAARRAVGERLHTHIERELAELNMERARFVVDMGETADAAGVTVEGRRVAFDATGLDKVEFLISANPGEEPRPLVKIASGGETSRLMLAMKTALSTVDPIPTLIFDEIDSGIGGRAGTVVGRKLASLAADHQVFCVTHLPQIASQGQQHFRVTKSVVGERTLSAVQALSDEERIEELALMIGGAITEATRRSAAEMLTRR
jgi:DNA repair protein RecN (Recombination protein N)